MSEKTVDACHDNAFEILKEVLKSKLASFRGTYLVPSLWVPVGCSPVDGGNQVSVNPYEFFLNHCDAIEKHKIDGINPVLSLNPQLKTGPGGSWLGGENVYNIFVRLSTAYDHDGNGVIGGHGDDRTLSGAHFRETGTFLKSIALLGYLKYLGITTVHLLPVTAIGRDGNKGSLGSPYAIRNPYALEPSLADPLIDEMQVEEQFKAFIQACHSLGIRIIAEFVFRTSSRDSDWIKENPQWFYWIDDRIKDRDASSCNPEDAGKYYGQPIFNGNELELINEKITRNDYNALPAPPENFRKFFMLPPKPEDISRNEKGQIRGLGKDPDSGKTVPVRVAGAFADWPPDDTQPPWGDVTYLRMYLDENPYNPRFNYIAYNTIRMYDSALARDELINRPLWEKISALIPFYQEKYGIDGVMVDMGHAVPVKLMQQIVTTARQKDPDFAFMSENFAIDESSVDAGYNAVVGYAWWVEYKRDGLIGLLDHIGRRGVPLPFLGAVENHNTPRAASRPGGEKYARYAFLVNTLLPNSIPFIHNGFELGETMPVNTGLDFSPDELKKLHDKPLPLFDISALTWDGSHPMLLFTHSLMSLREKYRELLAVNSTESFHFLQTGSPDVIAFLRQASGHTLMVLLNRDFANDLHCVIDLRSHSPMGMQRLESVLPNSRGFCLKFDLSEGILNCNLEAGESCLFAW